MASTQHRQAVRPAATPQEVLESAYQERDGWALLQALMRSPCMEEGAFRKLVQRVRPMPSAAAGDMYTFVLRRLNADLGFIQLRIKTLCNPVDQVKYVALVNLVADVSSKLASRLSIPQRDFFRAVVDHIAVQEAYVGGPGTPHESHMALLNLAVQPSVEQGEQPAAATVSAAKKVGKQEREATLDRLVADGWLSSVPEKNGYYALGPRTLMELGDYLLTLDVPPETAQAWQQIL